MSRDFHSTRPGAGPRSESYDSWRPGDSREQNYDRSNSPRQDSSKSSQKQSPRISRGLSRDSANELRRSLAVNQSEGSPMLASRLPINEKRSLGVRPVLQPSDLQHEAVAERQGNNAIAYHSNTVREGPATLEEPAISTFDISQLVKSLGETFKTFTEHATDVSALRIEERNAKKRYDDRQSEFNRSKEQHDKFPNTKTTQMDAKIQAEKVHRAINDQLAQKATALDNLVVEAARTLIPGLVGLLQAGGVSNEQKNLEERCNALERQIEKQRKDVEHLRTSNKRLEDKQIRMESDEQKRYSEHEKHLERELRGMSANLSKLNKDVEATMNKGNNLESRLDQLSTVVSQKFETIESVNVQVNKLANSKSEFDDFKQQVNKLSQHFEQTRFPDQTLIESAKADLMATIVKLADQQTATCDGLNTMINKKATSNQKEVDFLKQEVQRVEHGLRISSSMVTETVSSLQAQKQKLQETESSFQRNIAALDDQVKRSEKNKSRSTQVESLEKRLKLLENRTVKMEKQARVTQTPRASPTPSTPASNTAALTTELSLKLETMDTAIRQHRLDIDGIKSGQEGIEESMAGIITEMIQHATAGIGPQIQALEIKISGLESRLLSLINLPTQFKQLQDTQQENFRNIHYEISTLKSVPSALSSRDVVEIVRAEPGLIPDQMRAAKAIYELNQQMVAAHESLENLQARMNNINTGVLAAYMTDQLVERFPNVHAIDSSITKLRTDLTNIHISTTQMMDDLQKLHAHKAALQTQESVAAQIQDVRKTVNDLTLQTSSLLSLSNIEKENLQKLSEEHNNLKWETEQRVDTINDKIDDIYGALDTCKGTVHREIASAKPPTSSATNQRGMPNNQKTPVSSNRLTRGAGIIRPSPNQSSSNREASAVNSSNKKRKLSNGHSNSSSNPMSHKRGNKSSQSIFHQPSSDESDQELIQPGLQSEDEDQ